MIYTISLSFSFSTARPPPRSAWIKTRGNIRGPGTIGLSPRTCVLLQDITETDIIKAHFTSMAGLLVQGHFEDFD